MTVWEMNILIFFNFKKNMFFIVFLIKNFYSLILLIFFYKQIHKKCHWLGAPNDWIQKKAWLTWGPELPFVGSPTAFSEIQKKTWLTRGPEWPFRCLDWVIIEDSDPTFNQEILNLLLERNPPMPLSDSRSEQPIHLAARVGRFFKKYPK